MREHPAFARSGPLDQADGLRRLFAGRSRHVLPLVANPHVAFSALALDRLAAVLAARGHEVLVVDAGAASPPPHELARLDLGACVERLSAGVSYLPARGLPMAYIDTRGSAAGFIDAVQCASPQADVVLLHAEGADLSRVFRRRPARPILLGADHPDSVKSAYANLKLLASRCELMTFDLLLTVAPHSPRAAAIGASLADCADRFTGAALLHTALVDPAGDPAAPPDEALAALIASQLAMDEMPTPPVRPTTAGEPAAHHAVMTPPARAAARPNSPAFR